ncbi:hypothetical protein KWH75_10795 [Morganella morganii]|uniref:hypothetical protein n=1 Tax=Morganella morganii TaxID=582 RepID=UPI0021D2504B|nr:hypothetical protein [Morganella morganii]MCU6237552.1 hypothetical protein [Morganella morganii]
MKEYLSASAVAKLIVLNARLYAEEKGKAVTRYKISNNTFRKLSTRNCLRKPFLEDVAGELAELGWFFVQNNSDENCFMVMNATDNWPKLSAKRLDEIIKNAKKNKDESEIDKLYYDMVILEDI